MNKILAFVLAYIAGIMTIMALMQSAFGNTGYAVADVAIVVGCTIGSVYNINRY